MSIALISNATITSVAMKASRLARTDVFYPLSRNTWFQGLKDSGSKLYQCEPGCVFIILHGRTLLGEEGISSLEKAKAALSVFLDAIRSAQESHKETTFVVSTIDIPIMKIRPLLSARPEPQAAAFWRESLEGMGMPILELSEISAKIGHREFYNNRLWYMGYIPFSKTGEDAIAAEMDRIWRALKTPRKKCLVLNLDNTLWGGDMGELGIDGVHLDTVGSGARFYDLQRRILDLKEDGVLLALISKNNAEEAMAGINSHPAMLLREKDFAAIRINRDPKPENLKSIADELGIGTESFVFIDDNPIEREEMELAMPEVASPTPPADSSLLEIFLTEVARQHFLRLAPEAHEE
ncbi:MAG: HAD-IIIC family phosphatase [Synergistaceae bacterium]|jgi:HAD superfamily phosphatase (TIGR01681 family)|nr:HAD-IIIC family phosphatase [Synergistaceae bacterium]